ncbi:MAG: (2Fe-2S)-binding protein [Actinobacteria bacterium]|nr:(2Fe-2S)-binding protein [Actinomycetota bacterium]
MVCLCRGVSGRKVERAISHGASTVDEVGDVCQAGTSCGTCRETIHEMLLARVAVRPRPSFA